MPLISDPPIGSSNYMQVVSQPQHSRCECHECTQARWKMSFQGQLQGTSQPSPISYPGTDAYPVRFGGGIVGHLTAKQG